MHSYADVIEIKRANVRNCAFVAPSRVIEMKRMSGNYSFAEGFACIQIYICFSPRFTTITTKRLN